MSAWIGAAVLFVMVGVREVTSADFTSEVKDRLVSLRFPLFYATGSTLLSLGLAGTLLGLRDRQLATRGQVVASGLLLIALAVMLVDYMFIYQPLLALITPPGQVRTQQFQQLHEWSARINSLNLLICLSAASLLNWPPRVPRY